jgi:hypothetical protein
MKENLKEADYKMINYLGEGEFLLKEISSRNYEIWFANKNHASYGLIFKNTHLEFARTATIGDVINYLTIQ